MSYDGRLTLSKDNHLIVSDENKGGMPLLLKKKSFVVVVALSVYEKQMLSLT